MFPDTLSENELSVQIQKKKKRQMNTAAQEGRSTQTTVKSA